VPRWGAHSIETQPAAYAGARLFISFGARKSLAWAVAVIFSTLLSMKFAKAQFTIPMPAIGAPSLSARSAELRQSWIEDLEAGRLLSLVSHYAPDAALLDADGKHAIGLGQIRVQFSNQLTNTEARISFDSRAVASAGDLAYDSGSYTEELVDTTTHATRRVQGDYLTIYRKAGLGPWEIVQQAWTETRPPADAR
jgi:ketosteroid isomerase-like protein